MTNPVQSIDDKALPALSHEQTILGRSRRGRLFHIASEVTHPPERPHEWWSVRWICGPTIGAQHLRDYVVLPTDRLFGGIEDEDEGVCFRCHHKHNASAFAKSEARWRARDKQETWPPSEED